MWALERNAQSAMADEGLKRLRNGGRFQYSNGSTHAHKDTSVWRWRRVAFQMLHQSSRDFIGQREFQRGPRLTLMDAEDTLSPPDIIQRERDDLAGAQAIGGDQDEYRVVAQTNRGGDVDRSQKLDHGRPW